MFKDLDMDEIKKNPKVVFELFKKDREKAQNLNKDYIGIMLNIVEKNQIELLKFNHNIVYTDKKLYSYSQIMDFITMLQGLNFYISVVITTHYTKNKNSSEILVFQENIKDILNR